MYHLHHRKLELIISSHCHTPPCERIIHRGSWCHARLVTPRFMLPISYVTPTIHGVHLVSSRCHISLYTRAIPVTLYRYRSLITSCDIYSELVIYMLSILLYPAVHATPFWYPSINAAQSRSLPRDTCCLFSLPPRTCVTLSRYHPAIQDATSR